MGHEWAENDDDDDDEGHSDDNEENCPYRRAGAHSGRLNEWRVCPNNASGHLSLIAIAAGGGEMIRLRG